MTWKPMSLDEYAAYQRGNGATLRKIDNIWWHAVRPLYYHPLMPFQEIDRDDYRRCPSLGLGYKHAVKNPTQSNSCLNLIVFDRVQDYSLDKLKHKKRNAIKKAAGNLSIRTVDDLDHFVEGAFKVYRAFYERTKYSWKKQRVNKEKFRQWAANLFRCPKVVLHGIYRGSEMVAVNKSFLVEDILFDASFFSTVEGLRSGSSDLVWHFIREEAARIGNLRYIFEGVVSGKESLDNSKLQRGCKVLSLPAYLSLNRLILQGLKLYFPASYRKVLGIRQSPVHCDSISNANRRQTAVTLPKTARLPGSIEACRGNQLHL